MCQTTVFVGLIMHLYVPVKKSPVRHCHHPPPKKKTKTKNKNKQTTKHKKQRNTANKKGRIHWPEFS